MVGVAAVPVTVVSLPAEDGPRNQAGPEDCGESRNDLGVGRVGPLP